MTDPSDHTETLPGQPPGDGPSQPSASAVAGLTVSGRYRLEERLAVGGMASVWRARDQVLTRTVAVKLLHEHLAADPGFRERFRREAVAAAKLTHPNVVGLYDTGADGERVWLVMELVEGRTLRDLVAERSRLGVVETAVIGAQVARALDYAHRRGLIHRDVKPANILLGDGGVVKVADFGIAKAEEAGDDLTRTGLVLGTAAYVAPEQMLGEVVDGKADQYALGCVLFEAVTGRRPFDGGTTMATAARRLEHDPPAPRSLRSDVPEEFEAILLRALARRPEQRYPSTGDLADALQSFADEQGLTTVALAASASTGNGEAREPVQPVAAVLGPVPSGTRPRSESFLRSEGRWLFPVALVLLLVGGLIGAGLSTGVLQRTDAGEAADPDLVEQDGAAADEPGDADGGDAGQGSVEVADIAVFDPQGSGSENEDRLGGMLDGDPGTTWRTQTYTTPDFGNLKDGVGFWVDLGEAQEIDRVTLGTTTPGFDFDVRVADDPAGSADAWESVGSGEAAGEETAVTLDGDVTGRYVLLWITGPLQPSGGGYAVELTSLSVEGTR